MNKEKKLCHKNLTEFYQHIIESEHQYKRFHYLFIFLVIVLMSICIARQDLVLAVTNFLVGGSMMTGLTLSKSRSRSAQNQLDKLNEVFTRIQKSAEQNQR